jgi:hypothetical protein
VDDPHGPAGLAISMISNRNPELDTEFRRKRPRLPVKRLQEHPQGQHAHLESVGS